MSAPAPWLDTKDLLLRVLQDGYRAAGFGCQPLDTPPADEQHPTISFYRAMGQQAVNRPIVTVMRLKGAARSAWLGNAGNQVGYRGASSVWTPSGAGVDWAPVSSQTLPVIPLEESFSIRLEALQDIGGMPLTDWLVETANLILTNAYEALTTPVEAGGYGLYFPAWRAGADSERPFSEMSGKIVFANNIEFSNTRFVSGTPPIPGPSYSGFVIDLTTVAFGNATHIGEIG